MKYLKIVAWTFILWLMVLCAVELSNAQYISSTLTLNNGATTDTLIGTTRDTTEYLDRYRSSTSSPPGRAETININVTEIGTNTTHSWLQVEFYVASTALTRANADWKLIKREIYSDWDGYSNGTQGNMAIPIPWLSYYSERYLRLVLQYWRGTAADSTSYQVIYTADRNVELPDIGQNKQRKYSHYDLVKSVSAGVADSTAMQSTKVISTEIEVLPGIFQRATNGEVWAGGDGVKCDDDTLQVLVKGWFATTGTAVYIDTLLLPISTTTSSVGRFTFTLPDGGTTFPEAIRLYARPESNVVADTINFFIQTNFWIQ